MKVCERCGDEISGGDGENRCGECEEKSRKSKAATQRRKERDSIMSSLGLTKVKGALGGTYWE